MTKRPLLGLQVLCVALALAQAPEPAAAQQSGGATGSGTDNGRGADRAKSAPPPFPSFEARRVTAPKPGTPPKITIQITEPGPAPADTVTSPETASGPAGDAAEVGRYGWFWQRVPAGLEGEGKRNRLESALAALQSAPTPVSTPGLQLMQQIIQEQAVPILLSSAGTKVSPALVLAVIAVESSGESDAVSTAGASGLMQLMPDTAARFGVDDALNAAQNISGGIQYLDWLLEEFSGDAVLALAGYNAGEGAVRAHQGVPPFAETRDYVPKVLAAYQVARALCLTPPELISDGCVFRQLK
ncbi:lytic transglycosylase domain-containing protein [Pseudophaeobacter flagellatus]|uniref:lytic transglycosylase domain-containing protein n=1 Tax=Pseudophaeobacter flagellatus TaxID=2899119 RepID=UPI001E31FCD5|nr:lytic transglycosylase domain-containing protein [Pseudophaeobacter flagellatus]MCD9148426.1 lytic transglycosylase domain-containing protein [Pseudophaeobacter flagellatus]